MKKYRVRLKHNSWLPLFEEKELEMFDNNIHSIIEEYSKLHLEKKDQILTQRIIIKQEQEINRLNNIINKTIEYIEYNASCLHDEEILKDLLNILQGKEK